MSNDKQQGDINEQEIVSLIPYPLIINGITAKLSAVRYPMYSLLF